MTPGFQTEAAPARLTPLKVRPGIARMVAGNPGPLTYHGTNSWLVFHDAGVMVIDPGPDEEAHLAALAGAGKMTHILLTHTHRDHAAGAARLRAMTGAAIHGWHRPPAGQAAPDVALGDGTCIGPLTALHTPGHASDHLCFALSDGTLFSGDHVMAWATSVVIPPDGDMAAYMASLRVLLGRSDTVYLPGHGPVLENPGAMVRALLQHRNAREAAIARALTDTPRGEADIVAQLYTGLPDSLARAAARSVEAHLIKLAAEGRAGNAGKGWVRRTDEAIADP